MSIQKYTVRFPPNFEDEEWIWSSKGYVEVELEVGDPPVTQYSITIRDPVRLAQDIEAEFASHPVFNEPNVVVVPSVTRSSIERALSDLAERDFLGLLPA